MNFQFQINSASSGQPKRHLITVDRIIYEIIIESLIDDLIYRQTYDIE